MTTIAEEDKPPAVSCCFMSPLLFLFGAFWFLVYKNQRGHENNKRPLYQCSCNRLFVASVQCPVLFDVLFNVLLMFYLMFYLMRYNTDTQNFRNWQGPITVGSLQWQERGAG